MAVRLVALLVIVIGGGMAVAQDSSRPEEVERAIAAAAQQYVDAVNRGDLPALRSSWTNSGDYVDAQGNRAEASEMLADVVAAADQGSGRSLAVEVVGLRLVRPDVALEDGIAQRREADGSTTRTPYLAVWVKQDGRWLLDAVRETAAGENGNDTPLASLGWMIGTWAGEMDGARVLLKVRWIEDRKFLDRELTINSGNQRVLHATQRIGWDAATEEIKSWTFDSQGTHSEATWMRDGDSWAIDTLGVLGDGREVHATSKLKRNSDGTITWTVTGPPSSEKEIRAFTVQLRRVD